MMSDRGAPILLVVGVLLVTSTLRAQQPSGIVTLYEHRNPKGGDRVVIPYDNDVRAISKIEDEASFVTYDLSPGVFAILYEHKNFKGNSKRLEGKGQLDLHGVGLGDRVSSIKWHTPKPAPIPNPHPVPPPIVDPEPPPDPQPKVVEPTTVVMKERPSKPEWSAAMTWTMGVFGTVLTGILVAFLKKWIDRTST